uniref:Small ribosomal subunit protein uS3c n=1 Tax=Chlamydomonas leiostraca TaxID=1034604 RepID=A0A1L2M579_9CHLO|nr:ribosomal protein S3 [Chlamydomonas leiostraca]APD80622.1 ribosomal protein S3 [Chlamydomonas leiostraca]
MGQKVHPLGFRVGITKKHQSQWFARFNKNKYAQSVLEDRMLREGLSNLFPQLLNPVLKKKRDDASSVVPKITQIKIERGLIPSEIGIQIHAENCELIKSSIENLKVSRDLVAKLQKTRRYLQHLRLKLNDFSTITESVEKTETKTSTSLTKGAGEAPSVAAAANKKQRNSRFRTRTRLTKQQLRRRRLILKRLKKRQSIRRRFSQMVYKRLFLAKKGASLVIQKLTSGTPSNKTTKSRFAGRNAVGKKAPKGLVRSQGARKAAFTKQAPRKTTKKSALSQLNSIGPVGQASILKLRIKKKFVSIFVNRMNNKFLQVLKSALNETSRAQTAGQKTMRWSPKWNFAVVQKRLASKSVAQLTKLISALEQKALKKMESLRKDFITFGFISKASSFRYYQMLTFLKQLKQFVSKIKTKQKLQYTLAKLNNSADSSSAAMERFNVKASRLTVNGETNLKMNLLSKKLNNIENECRKMKFIEYLKQLVKKHRSENIYLYLATIADARKDLRKLKQFTKRHAAFLFGLNVDQMAESRDKVQERVRTVLADHSAKSELEKTLNDVVIEQIEKQRNMYKDNAQLTPKIAIKFYSVNPKTIKAKASFVADSVVDALEKRKAFRKVIKDAKEELMRTPGVKGVKIQVSGRLNGAEIARSEWVRAGRVPLQTLRANLDYAYKTANTIYGIIGIKVWIFKGYTKIL